VTKRVPPPGIFSADEGAGVGLDDATPVTSDYKERENDFTGKIIKVIVDVKPVGAAVKAAADAGQRESAVKQGLSNQVETWKPLRVRRLPASCETLGTKVP
jgi:arylsulfatase